jgi:hypothetical protein
MPRKIPTWTAAPVAALGFLIASYAGLGIIESITAAAVPTICWSFVIRIVASLTAEEGESDGSRD